MLGRSPEDHIQSIANATAQQADTEAQSACGGSAAAGGSSSRCWVDGDSHAVQLVDATPVEGAGVGTAGAPAVTASATEEVAVDEVVMVREAACMESSESAAMKEGEEVPAGQAEVACDEQRTEADQAAVGDDSCGALPGPPHRQRAAFKTSGERFDFLRSKSGPDLGHALLAFFDFYGAAGTSLRGVMDPLAPQVQPL